MYHPFIHPQSWSDWRLKLIRFSLILCFIVFVSEWISMEVISSIPIQDSPEWIIPLVDSTLMLLIAAGPIYFFILNPLFSLAYEKRKGLQMLGAIIESARDSILITDSQAKIIYVNKAFEKTTGYTFFDVKGKTPSILSSGRHSKEFHEKMWDTLIATGRYNGELWNRKKNGDEYCESLSITKIGNDKNDEAYYVGQFNDISYVREMEGMILHGQKMDALGTLIAGVAHNFNNVLAGIMGQTYLARKGKKPTLHLDKIDDLTNKASSIVGSLLAYSRNDDPVKSKHCLREICLEAFSLSEMGFSEIYAKFTAPEERFPIFASKTHVEQAIVNLLNNARDAVDSCEKREIFLSLEKKSMVCNSSSKPIEVGFITIMDSGTGIPAELVDKIFDPFFTTKQIGKGTGLGLSMVAGTIQSHGGDIKVSSLPGRGTTFHITLPLSEEKVELSSKAEVKGFASEPNKETGTILIVDDNKSVRDALMILLENLGYSTLVSSDGEEAESLYGKLHQKIELIICDGRMPRKSGYKFVKYARGINAKVPVIFVSGDILSKKYHELIDSRTVIMQKPFEYSKLTETVNNMILDKNDE